MEEYLVSLFTTFKNYVEMLPNTNQWWLIPLTSIVIWLVTFISTKLIKDHQVFTREFQIHKLFIGISIVVELILISWFVYNWKVTDAYKTDNEKLVHLLSILSCIVVQLLSYRILAYGFKREKLQQNINQPFTRKDENVKRKKTIEQFKRIKLWSLIPVLGFLIILIPIKEDKNLVSFLLDNSSSMDIHLSNGKEILKKSFKSFGDNTDIILSWFSENNPKTDFNALINTKDSNKLEGIHQYFPNTKSAIDALETIDFTDRTPLYESIWSSYLYTKSIVENKKYQKVIFVLVTDGEDSYLKKEPSGFLCDIAEFDAFYEDHINIINLQESNDDFFQKSENCGYTVYEGMNLDSYGIAIQEILQDITKDNYFPIWLSIFCISGIIMVLLITPKKY